MRTAKRVESVAAAVAPCVLTGRWDARLERPGYKVAGTIEIDAMPDSLAPQGDPQRRRWRGRYDIEWWRLWGPKEGQVRSSSTRAGTAEEIRHGIEAHMDGDTISLALSPLISHGPISLWGIWRGDTIRGEWRQRSGALPPGRGEPDADRPPHGTALLTRPLTGCGNRAA